MNEIPDTGYDIIGSTEFYPLKVNKNIIHPKLLKYFLLHKNFREIAKFLRTGKSQSHPRIQKDDFFNLKIPLLKKQHQIKLVNKIEKLEKEINKYRNKIEKLTDIVDETFELFNFPTKINSKKNKSFWLVNNLNNFNKTYWLGMRPHLCQFVE